MTNVLAPVTRQNLSDEIAQRIAQLIRTGKYEIGSRLPAISDMARQFGVGAPTLREALKKLEAVGAVDIRHGSGVYVGRASDSLVITNPVIQARATKKLLVDLIEARIPIESRTAALAARNATAEHLEEMNRLLTRASESFDDSALLTAVNLAFHREIALASGNVVMHQILDVLASLFKYEQRLILDIHGRREDDHHEHVQIYEAVRARDEALAVERMRSHLESVRDKLIAWKPRGDR
jgi:GntR family transcriptional repressor for pyruvate dehydrogenase complex